MNRKSFNEPEYLLGIETNESNDQVILELFVSMSQNTF